MPIYRFVLAAVLALEPLALGARGSGFRPFVAWVLLLALAAAPVAAQPPDAAPPTVEDLAVLQLSAADRRAVVRFGEGDPRVVAPGDSLSLASDEGRPGRAIRVVEVLADRLVVEVRGAEPGEPARKAWIRPPEGRGRPSRVQWLDAVAPPAPTTSAPIFHEPETPVTGLNAEGSVVTAGRARPAAEEPPL